MSKFNDKVFYFNPLRVCTYVLWDETMHCAIVDPGCISPGEEHRLAEFVEQTGLTPDCVLLTHGHFDHIFGLDFVVRRWDIPVYMHPADNVQIERSYMFAQSLGFEFNRPSANISPLAEGPIKAFGETFWEVISTPGHTQGGVCFHHKDEGILFSGDTLFCHGVGRTDHPGGNFSQMMASIREKILPLPVRTKVLPGHGYDTTLEEELASNPFLAE